MVVNVTKRKLFRGTLTQNEQNATESFGRLRIRSENHGMDLKQKKIFSKISKNQLRFRFHEIEKFFTLWNFTVSMRIRQ